MFMKIVCLLLFCAYGGSSPTTKDGRIVGGEGIDITEAPYQVSLLWAGRHTCGGTLIDKDLVLTAAHCIWDPRPSQYKIRAGSSFKSKDGVVMRVSKLIKHPDFNMVQMDHDVAILKLVEPLEFSEKVAAIPLMDSDLDLEDGAETVVTGWGDILEGAGLAPEQLQRVYVPKVNQEQCAEAYKPSYAVTENMLCAGLPTGGKDACQGDSGGPLIADGKLAGVVSWGIGCARPKFPGVYAKVSALRTWIDKNILLLRAQEILRNFAF